MSLDSGTKIGRYEIQSLLGAGGMGEVYRAFDTQLEREVALKFLKQSNDKEKLRRFRQEAKVVSALNHPNILSIHEVGEYDSSPFIVSELVKGENLRDLTAKRNLSLNEILDICVQVGKALAAAHAVGIAHRDIKPENIMVLPDDSVKVLDFGLAKFVDSEKKPTHDSVASTASLVHTKAGMIIGTVNYMSPEQLRGKSVDERADVWSLGIVLFEMLTRRRPFTGESANDVIAAILERPLPSISEINPYVPAEIEFIVARSLEKEREDRFQKMKDVILALKNAKFFAGNDNAISDKEAQAKSFHSQKTLFTSRGKVSTADSGNLSGLFIGGTQIRWRILALAALILTAGFGLSGWIYIYKPLAEKSVVKQPKFERLTTTGNITNAVISPDGRLIAYVVNNNGQQSLWLREVEETTGKELIPPKPESYAGLTFAPDGDWIYYTVFNESGAGTLNRIRFLGGSKQEIRKDIDSPVSFSPDGKSYAFIRGNPKEGVDCIIVANTEAGGERVLSRKNRPEFYTINSRESLAWSPDGKFIASPFGRINPDGEFMSVAEINVETGEEKLMTTAKWHRVGRVVWTSDADELLITAAEPGSELFQIIKIHRSNQTSQNITGELSDYYNLSLNKDATLLLGVSYDKTSNLFTASSEQPSRARQIAGGSYDGIGGVSWTADGQIIYVSTESGNRDIWTMDADGGNRRRLTLEKAADDFPVISNDGKFIVFVSSRNGVPHLWRMNVNGGDLKQLTDEGGENLPAVTPDGKFVVYSSRTNGRPVLWKISVEGGKPSQLTEEQTNWATISPDGKLIACLVWDGTLDPPMQLAVFSAESGSLVKTFKPSGIISSPGLAAAIRWTPDGKAIAYAANTDGISNIWTQNITGGEPQKLTDFTIGKIFSFDWSKDGRHIVYARGELRNDLILIKNF